VIHQERIGQTGVVERAVNPHGYNGLAITLVYVHNVERDINGEDLLIGPLSDRDDAANFPPHVSDNGIRGEARLKHISITGVDCPDVNRFGQFYFLFHYDLKPCCSLRSWGCFRRQ